MTDQYYAIFFRRVLIAIQFLTRIPVWLKQKPKDKDIGCSASYYPFVGLIIGSLLFMFLGLLQLISIPASSAILAALVLVFWVVITGGLHLVGLADSADALVRSTDGLISGLADKEKNIALIKDGRSGTMGVIALILLLLLKWVALESLIEHGQNWFLIFIPSLARAYILLLLGTTEYVSKDGLAETMRANFPAQKHIITVLFISTLVFIFSLGFSLVFLSLLVFILLRYQMKKHLQGCTGDTIGAMVEIIEMSTLIFMVFLAS
jgi:adenosylcobinamide-GDP ribazoletransferase